MSFATMLSVTANGSLLFDSTAQPESCILRVPQTFLAEDVEGIFAFVCDTTPASSTPMPDFVGLWPKGSNPMVASMSVGFLWSGGVVKAVGTSISDLFAVSEVASTRLAFRVGGGTYRYFQDATDYSTAIPIGARTFPIVGEYELFIQQSLVTGKDAKLLNPEIVRHIPSALYSADDQTDDFGSTQSSVHVKVYQISAIAGRGEAADATV